MRRIGWAMVLLGAFLAGIAPAGRAAATDFDKVLPLPSGGHFALQNVNGSVEIDGWDKDQVDIKATKTGRYEHDLELVSIDVQTGEDGVAVHTHYPHGDGVEVAVDYKVHVPYRILLGAIETVNGNILVTSVEGAGDLRTVNGDVEILSSAGRFNAHTTNGNLHYELRKLPEGMPITASTVNGSVLVELPEDSSSELRVDNLNGGFTSEIPIQSKASIISRGFSAQLGHGGSEFDLGTMNGDIHIAVAKPVI